MLDQILTLSLILTFESRKASSYGELACLCPHPSLYNNKLTAQ
jgi:hypothetical protein